MVADLGGDNQLFYRNLCPSVANYQIEKSFVADVAAYYLHQVLHVQSMLFWTEKSIEKKVLSSVDP